MNIAVSELLDYPPRLLIYIKHQAASNLSSPELEVNGLDRKCCFKLLPVSSENFTTFSNRIMIPMIVLYNSITSATADSHGGQRKAT